MKTNTDLVMSALAKKLSGLSFQHDVDPPANLKLAVASEGKLKGVQLMPQQNSPPAFSVRSFCGGRIRYFAFFRTNWVAACRIADMLTLRIGSRRLKFPRPIEPSDYNFGSAEQAEKDWKNEPLIAELLTKMEDHLKKAGALDAPTGITGTHRTALLTRIELLEQRMEIMAKALQALCTTGAQ